MVSEISLPDRATFTEATPLLAALQAALPTDGGTLRIDAAPLQHFDTSLLALLLHARRSAHAAGGAIEIAGASTKLADLAQLYGVESLLPLALASAGPATSAA